MPRFGSPRTGPELDVLFHGSPSIQTQCTANGLHCVEEDYRSSALQNPMHPIVAKLADWSDLASGQQWLVQQEGMGIPCPPCGLLPVVEVLLAACSLALVQAMVGLDDIIVGGQLQLVVLGRPMVNDILACSHGCC